MNTPNKNIIQFQAEIPLTMNLIIGNIFTLKDITLHGGRRQRLSRTQLRVTCKFQSESDKVLFHLADHEPLTGLDAVIENEFGILKFDTITYQIYDEISDYIGLVLKNMTVCMSASEAQQQYEQSINTKIN
jgi:hypothetical protein